MRGFKNQISQKSTPTNKNRRRLDHSMQNDIIKTVLFALPPLVVSLGDLFAYACKTQKWLNTEPQGVPGILDDAKRQQIEFCTFYFKIFFDNLWSSQGRTSSRLGGNHEVKSINHLTAIADRREGGSKTLPGFQAARVPRKS